jgi:hypothetical protein
MYLYRLIYYTENKIRDLNLTLVKEIKAIHAAGHRNNPPAGLTGTLAFNERWFLGVLEGDRKRVSTMLLKLAADRRAEGLVVLSMGAIDERMFDTWSVVYAGHSEQIDRLYLHHGLVSGLDPVRASAPAMLAVAHGLATLDIPLSHREAPSASSQDGVELIRVQHLQHV